MATVRQRIDVCKTARSAESTGLILLVILRFQILGIHAVGNSRNLRKINAVSINEKVVHLHAWNSLTLGVDCDTPVNFLIRLIAAIQRSRLRDGIISDGDANIARSDAVARQPCPADVGRVMISCFSCGILRFRHLGNNRKQNHRVDAGKRIFSIRGFRIPSY